MQTLIPTEHALALTYLKEGMPSPQNTDTTLGELWGLGGDFEVTMHLLEEVVPTAEEMLADTGIDTITKLYEFYGETLGKHLVQDPPEGKEALKT